MDEIKRYYPFGDQTRELWQNCPKLRSILGKSWLERQAGNQLYWQAHPLFIHFCNNSPLISMLETTLKQSSPQNLSLIEKNLKSFGTRANLEGFFAELFIMTRLTSKNVEFEYTPNKEGVDFILPTLENLHIEVTSRQAESWDGRSEAMMRWEECLPIFKTGLSLLLIDAENISGLLDSDWLEGFEYFDNFIKERKGTIQIGEEIQPQNRSKKKLAYLSVEKIDNDSQKPTVVCIPQQVYALDQKKETQNFIRMITQKLQEKSQKCRSEFCVLCIDLTHWSFREAIPLSNSFPHCRAQVISSLEIELTKYPHVIYLILFQRNFIDMNISPFLSIPNPNSTLAKNNPKLFRETLDIFAP